MEIKRRTDMVDVFPNPAALLRLAGSVLIEPHDEWTVSDRRFCSERSEDLLVAADSDIEGRLDTPALMTAWSGN